MKKQNDQKFVLVCGFFIVDDDRMRGEKCVSLEAGADKVKQERWLDCSVEMGCGVRIFSQEGLEAGVQRNTGWVWRFFEDQDAAKQELVSAGFDLLHDEYKGEVAQ